MNITKVTYEDKEAIQNDETIAEKNKVTANNMNQIKKTINDNADVLTEVKNTVDELNEDVGNIKTVQTAQNSTISNMNNAIVQNSEEIYENANNIVELQKENTALKEELERQKEDNKLNGLTEDNEGEMLHITNTTGARFNSLEIFGNEKQETRSGKNIYGAGSKWFNNIGGTNLNVSERTDSSCVLTATGRGFTSFGSGQAGGSSEYRTEIEPNTEYTFSLKAELLSGSNGFGIYAFFSKDGSSEYFSEKHVDYADEITFVTPENAKYFYFRVDIFNASASYRISEIQLEKGSKATEFEEYGAMPSFDYPSEVKAVGGNVNIFNDEVYKGFEVTQQNYNALEKVDLKLEANKYYVAKIYFEDGTSVAVNNSNFMLYAYKSDGTQSANIPNGIAKTYANATELVKAKIVANSTGLSTYANKVIAGIKIEEVADEEGQPTPYGNYGQGCIELNITNKNVLHIQKNSTVTKAGMTVTTDKDGILTLNGTTTSAIYIGLNKNNFIMQAGNLFERSMFRKGNYNFSVDNLSSTQTLNASAYIRKSYNSGEIVYLESVFSAKHRDKNFILEEDKEAVVYLWIASGITLNNAKLKFQIELDNATDIVTNEEQNYIIPVQQRMFSGDKFVKLDGQWKEMHTMGTVYSKDVSVGVGNATSNVDDFYRYSVNFGQLGRKRGSYIKILSNYFKYADSRWNKEEGICGWENGQIFCIGTYNKNFDTAEKLKTFLTENNVEIAYELAKPIYLDCTKEQISVLNKIEQEAHTFADVTNVYTEDEVGAIIKTNTNVDLSSIKETLDNIQKQIIA